MKFLDYEFAHSSLTKMYLYTYDGAAALLHVSGAMASTISASAHCLVTWHGLRPAKDVAIGDSHEL